MVYEVEQLRREQAIHSLPILLDQPMPRRKDHRKSKETTRNTMAMAENMVIAGSQVDASRRSSIARLRFHIGISPASFRRGFSYRGIWDHASALFFQPSRYFRSKGFELAKAS